MKTIFPEYIDYIECCRNGTPYDGQRTIIREDFVYEDHQILFLLEFSKGKLHGDSAVTSDTGYFETWENGKFISSMCVGTKPKKIKIVKKTNEEIFDQMKEMFEKKWYVTDDSSDVECNYLPDDVEAIIEKALIEDPFKKK